MGSNAAIAMKPMCPPLPTKSVDSIMEVFETGSVIYAPYPLEIRNRSNGVVDGDTQYDSGQKLLSFDNG
jgi:hypothetical protein